MIRKGPKLSPVVERILIGVVKNHRKAGLWWIKSDSNTVHVQCSQSIMIYCTSSWALQEWSPRSGCGILKAKGFGMKALRSNDTKLGFGQWPDLLYVYRRNGEALNPQQHHNCFRSWWWWYYYPMGLFCWCLRVSKWNYEGGIASKFFRKILISQKVSGCSVFHRDNASFIKNWPNQVRIKACGTAIPKSGLEANWEHDDQLKWKMTKEHLVKF